MSIGAGGAARIHSGSAATRSGLTFSLESTASEKRRTSAPSSCTAASSNSATSMESRSSATWPTSRPLDANRRNVMPCRAARSRSASACLRHGPMGRGQDRLRLRRAHGADGRRVIPRRYASGHAERPSIGPLTCGSSGVGGGTRARGPRLAKAATRRIDVGEAELLLPTT